MEIDIRNNRLFISCFFRWLKDLIIATMDKRKQIHNTKT